MSYPRERSSISFVKRFRALFISERGCLTIASHFLSEVIVATGACPVPCMENVERRFFDFKEIGEELRESGPPD